MCKSRELEEVVRRTVARALRDDRRRRECPAQQLDRPFVEVALPRTAPWRRSQERWMSEDAGVVVIRWVPGRGALRTKIRAAVSFP